MTAHAGLPPTVVRHWARLKYTGSGETPSRKEIGSNLLQSQWITALDVHSFIAMTNKKDYEICFNSEQALQKFTSIFNTNGNSFWENWEINSSSPVDTKYVIVKFWTGRIADADIEQYLLRFCQILQPVYKPVDEFGFWYGVRKYKIKLKKNPDGTLMKIPSSISMGPYNGKISYPGQTQSCFICNAHDHQAKDCGETRCWKCGNFGHKGKDCNNREVCNLCQTEGHTFFQCPNSYSNKLKSRQQQAGEPSTVQIAQVQSTAGKKTKQGNQVANSWEETKLDDDEEASSSGSSSTSGDDSDSDSDSSESDSNRSDASGRHQDAQPGGETQERNTRRPDEATKINPSKTRETAVKRKGNNAVTKHGKETEMATSTPDMRQDLGMNNKSAKTDTETKKRILASPDQENSEKSKMRKKRVNDH